MASSVTILHLFEEIIYDRLYYAYDRHLRLSNVTNSHNALFSPFRDQSELLVNLNSSLIGCTLEQFPNFLDIFQRVASNYSPSGKAILDDTHSHVVCIITPKAIMDSLGLSKSQCQTLIPFTELEVL